jgi:hypothetical protein
MLQRRFSFVFAIAVLVLAAPRIALSGYLDEQDDAKVGIMERALAKLVHDARYFDGKVVPEDADLRLAGDHLRLLVDNMAGFRKHYDELSEKGKARTKVCELLAKWKQEQPYVEAFSAAYDKAVAAAKTAAKAKAERDTKQRAYADMICEKFADEIHLRDNGGTLDLAVNVMNDFQWYYSVEAVKEARAALDHTAAVCARDEFADIGQTCGNRYGGEFLPREQNICKAAAARADVLERGVMGNLTEELQHLPAAPTLASLQRDDGWFMVEDAITYGGYLTFGAEAKKAKAARLVEMFAAAGVEVPMKHPLWTAYEARTDALRAAVDELAPTLKLPGSSCDGYGCGMAKKQLAAWYPKAKIKKVTAWDTAWVVTDTELGVPDYRSRDGYILYQVPGDPWCQARSWTVTEEYSGGGKYQKASGVRFNFVRFQSCE